MNANDYGRPADHPEPPAVARTKRLLNRWSLFGLLALCAAAIVLFVSNAIAVNKLTAEVDDLKQRRDRLLRDNDRLRSEIVRLQSPDRITELARKKLGMVQAATAPKRLK